VLLARHKQSAGGQQVKVMWGQGNVEVSSYTSFFAEIDFGENSIVIAIHFLGP
jgi:hypothetical protein